MCLLVLDEYIMNHQLCDFYKLVVTLPDNYFDKSCIVCKLQTKMYYE